LYLSLLNTISVNEVRKVSLLNTISVNEVRKEWCADSFCGLQVVFLDKKLFFYKFSIAPFNAKL